MKRLISIVLILCLTSGVCVPVVFADNGVGYIYSTDFEDYTSLVAGAGPDSNWSYVNSGNKKYFKSHTEADGNNCMELEWYSEPMLFFGQMPHDQPLPAALQIVHMAFGIGMHAAAPGSGLQKKMDFGVMAKGLVMSRAHHRRGNGFPVQHAALAE